MTVMLVYASILGVLFAVGLVVAHTQSNDSWSAGSDGSGTEDKKRDSAGGCGGSGGCGGCGGCGG